ncbi:DUF4186 family protein [Halobacteriovorax sp. HLS]|uniref:DUF4186 family protein n=1 Tax=Halobacteriovorax sp. HLS TaxID=2234000 RepID=UPI0013E2C0D0|nr:DUF4186 family protein [Halobacteriovorax sp. HLS]
MQNHELIYFTDVFKRLKKSSICNKFTLKEHEWNYLANRGLDSILLEGRTLIIQRYKESDENHCCRKSPLRHHPILVALHATGTCCRESLFKWHGIDKDNELREKDIFYILLILKEWFVRQVRPAYLLSDLETEQLNLFCS